MEIVRIIRVSFRVVLQQKVGFLLHMRKLVSERVKSFLKKDKFIREKRITCKFRNKWPRKERKGDLGNHNLVMKLHVFFGYSFIILDSHFKYANALVFPGTSSVVVWNNVGLLCASASASSFIFSSNRGLLAKWGFVEEDVVNCK